jgi:hypothetical protein
MAPRASPAKLGRANFLAQVFAAPASQRLGRKTELGDQLIGVDPKVGFDPNRRPRIQSTPKNW